MRRLFLQTAFLSFVSITGGKALAADKPTDSQTTVEFLQSSGRFTTFLSVAESADLIETLGSKKVTVFAPDDDAFARLPEGTVEYLEANPKMLRDLLLYHVAVGEVDLAFLSGLTEMTMLNRKKVCISSVGGLYLDSSPVSRIPVGIAQVRSNAYNIETSNGLIHEINKVLIPPSLIK